MKRAPALVLAALAALALAAWWLVETRGAGARKGASAEPPAGRTSPDPIAQAPSAQLADAGAEPGAGPAAPRTAATAPAPAGIAALRPPPEADVRRVRLFGRVEDPQGRPIAGAALLSPPDDAAAVLARTDAEGRLDAELALAVDRPPLADWYGNDHLSAAVAAAGHIARSVELEVSQGARFHLGTVVLVLGVPVSGRVVDAAGRGVADADLQWYPAAQLDMLRTEAATGEIHFLPPRSDPVHSNLALGGSSASDGSFRLSAVPREPGLLAGLADAHGIGLTDVLPFDAGEQVDVRIELPDGTPVAPRARVAGTVVRPDGTPHLGAQVTLLAPDRSIRGWATSGAEGRFEVLLHPAATRTMESGLPFAVRAVDVEQGFSAGEVPGVLPDGPEVVVQLTPARVIEVRLVDRSGAPVPWGHVRSSDAGEPWPMTGLGAEARRVFLRPDRSFHVQAFAPGFRTETFGPFDEASLGTVLELTLTPGEAVRGRVLAGGKPVAGARVALTRTPYAAGRVGRARGVAPSDRPFDLVAVADLGQPDATTAQDGTFVATLHAGGWHTVAAEADGYARCVQGPFEWTLAEGASGLVLELERPGAIEGRVRVPAGERVEGRLVAVSDGAGEARIAAADAQGRFRIEGLAPGGWQVRPSVPPLGERARLEPSGVSSSERDVRFDVLVRAGETSTALLDLAAAPEHVLQGRVTLDGAGLAGARVELHPGDLHGRVDDHSLASGELAGDGSFELRLFSGGPVILSILGQSDLRILQRLDLGPSVSAWELALEGATLTITGTLPQAPGTERTTHVLCTRALGGALVFRGNWPKAAPGEPLSIPLVPAGEVDLLFASGAEVMLRGYLDDSLWTRAASVHLDPGGEVTLALP